MPPRRRAGGASSGQDSDADGSDSDAPPPYKVRAFGSGLGRKPVSFVKAQDNEAPPAATDRDRQSASEAYLSIVFKDRKQGESEQQKSDGAGPAAEKHQDTKCPICGLAMDKTSSTVSDTDAADPRATPHEASVAHMACLAHSAPPSSLDRSRMGLHVLQSHGWDPDARKGLGQGGRLYPVKATARPPLAGLGAEASAEQAAAAERAARREAEAVLQGRTRGGRARGRAVAAARDARLRALVYGRDDVNAALGIGL